MITITPLKTYNQSFGTFFNTVPNDDGKLRYRGDTIMCRADLDFPELVNYLDNKYRNVPKVNVIMHACSDGEEVYSFLGVLISRLKEKASKFLPVSAKDIDSNHLKLAKRGVYNITKSEYINANRCMDGKFYNFFEPMPLRGSKDPRLKYTTTVKAEHSLKSLVKFEQSNILEDAQNLNFSNTVIFARNFWPYLSSQERNKLLLNLSKKMDSSSILIIGDFDQDNTNIGMLLRKYGYVEKLDNVFEKSDKNKIKELDSMLVPENYYSSQYFSNINQIK